ncbi:MAG: ornithine cyclodeaminase family protein [Halieaceae bacterium]|jgi:ornithine cyclodeaminase|nr:ornithine cyclodeaminase family protein [Halieaceae bacterium]
MASVLNLQQIKRLVDPAQLIGEIEAGFVLYSQGQTVVPPVGFMHFDQPPGDVHIKYGYVTGGDFYILKMASAFYNNPNLDLPVSDGVILVFNQQTGQLELVLLDECWLTDMRTAAAGAVAARHLAPASIQNIGIVGTGVQARMQLEMLRHVIDCQRCIIWGRDERKVQNMIADLQARESIQSWGLELIAATDLDELVAQCNLIVTTTPATKPLIRSDLVRKGTHITAMGSDDSGKQELETDLLAKADRVVADSISQCIDHGECVHAINDNKIEVGAVIELGDVINNPKLGRTDEDQITVADLTGVAIQDIQIARMVDRARRSAGPL